MNLMGGAFLRKQRPRATLKAADARPRYNPYK